jgi:hypothetical protein
MKTKLQTVRDALLEHSRYAGPKSVEAITIIDEAADELERLRAELAASKEANRVALVALSMPCDRWNGTQTKIVSAAITKLKAVLK